MIEVRLDRSAATPTGPQPVAQERHASRTGVLVSVLAASLVLYLTTQSRSLVDLKVYLGAATFAWDEGSLYDFHYGPGHIGFTYPPFAALLFLPAAALPFAMSATGATVTSIVAL